MKIFTKSMLILGVALCGFSASADESVWNYSRGAETFIPIHRSNVSMADFNNDGKLDIFVIGNGYCNYYNRPGLWNWQTTASLYYNLGDNNWARDIIEIEPTGEFTDEVPDDPNTEENEYVAPQEKYRFVPSKHNMCPCEWPNVCVFDYNNDGLVDIFYTGRIEGKGGNDWLKHWENVDYTVRINNAGSETDDFMVSLLYKNNGDGTFTYVPEAGIPCIFGVKDDGFTNMRRTIAAGDYDRDGYMDILISGYYAAIPEGHPRRACSLFRNINGTGRFEEVLIAEPIGGAWTDARKETVIDDATGDETEIEIPGEALPEGSFMPVGGDVMFVDLDNDGWLDIVSHGTCNNVQDARHHQNGSTCRIYKNMEGKKFVDVTAGGEFYTARGASISVADLDGDTYLDLVNIGWCDHGIGWASYAFYNNGEGAEYIYDYPTDMAAYGWPMTEQCRPEVRDFNGDGYLDLWCNSAGEGRVYHGSAAGTYEQHSEFPHIRDYNGANGMGAVGDVMGNGLADRFNTGYFWIDGGVFEEGFVESNGGWCNAAFLMTNETEADVEAPEAPTNVAATINEDNLLTITWNDIDDDATVAYNVVIKGDNGSVIATVPVNPETGYLLVSDNKHQAVRPGIQSYSLTVPAGPKYTAGVQAISLFTETQSAIVYAPEVESGVEGIVVDDVNAPIQYFNLQGVRVAEPANGIFIRKQGSKVSKVVK